MVLLISRKRYSVDQIIPILRRADMELGCGKKIPDVGGSNPISHPHQTLETYCYCCLSLFSEM